MSNKVRDLVKSRIVGSPTLKAVLLNMADRADDLGRDVFPSKSTIEGETGLKTTAVKTAIGTLVKLGLIRKAGECPCQNGHTVNYDLDLIAIEALPSWEAGRNIGAKSSTTGSPRDPVATRPGRHATVTGSPRDREGVATRPQTFLEPSLNKSAGARGAKADGKSRHDLEAQRLARDMSPEERAQIMRGRDGAAMGQPR